MEKFIKLSKEEMRRISGGVPPVCNVGNGCAGQGAAPVLFGVCVEVGPGGCGCMVSERINPPGIYCSIVE
jgi:hypothetical protein